VAQAREHPSLMAEDEMFMRDRFSSQGPSNWGQIPIQDNSISGDKPCRTKLGSDPNCGRQRQGFLRPAIGVRAQFRSAPFASVSATVLNWDLTPIAPSAPIVAIAVPSRSARNNVYIAVSGVCGGPAVEAPPEQRKAWGQRVARSSSFSLRLIERSAKRVASSAVRPQALRCAGKPPQAAGDVGRPSAHTAHRRLQNIRIKPRTARLNKPPAPKALLSIGAAPLIRYQET
jgi:hypothetical protein